MIIFYHGDMDGIVSANLLSKGILNDENYSYTKIHCVKFEYDKEPTLSESFDNLYTAREQEVYFVDCCPSENTLQEFVRYTKKVTVLDHHISKKQLVDDFLNAGLIEGMSYIGASATLIVWAWVKFNKDIDEIVFFLDSFNRGKWAQDKSDVPLSLRLVNSWDIWNGYYEDAEPFKIFFETQNFYPLDDEVNLLLNDNFKISDAITKGKTMQQFFHQWGNIYCNRFGYEVQYYNNVFFVLNVGNANSKIFGGRINIYDAVIIYCYDGDNIKCSIYSQKEDFDCSKFAEKFGGGGHKGAAGFTLDKIPLWLKRKRGSGLNGN